MIEELYERKQEKMKELLKRLATEFLTKEVDPPSMVTVTNVEVTSSGHEAKILLTCFPAEAEPETLKFLKGEVSSFSRFVASHSRMRRIPEISFMIDEGEKNRQRIEAIANSQKRK